MAIVVNLDVMLARRKMRSRELAERIGITEQNLSLLKSGKVRGVRFETLSAICQVLQCQPGDLLAWQPDDESNCTQPAPIPRHPQDQRAHPSPNQANSG
jgi:putative transcriptional regulator